VRNRQTWTVTAVRADGSLDVADRERGSVRLPAAYVARHVELGWAVTGYGSQGVTVDHGICVVEPSSTRAGIYVGMTRGRDRNLAVVVDATGLDNAEEAFAAAIARPPNALTAHAVRRQLYEAHGVAVQEDPTLDVRPRSAELAVPTRSAPSLSI
jgi:ATP-dependent exoDNAse (exonuclease V) alpha subunit